MKLFTAKNNITADKMVVLDDMILTKDMPTAAGSKMLDGYMSLFDATVVEKLSAKGYGICGKANVGELAIDLLGETSFYGAVADENGVLSLPVAEIINSGEADSAIVLDVNGSPRRGAALSGLVSVKPTYGTVSRFGTIPAACSGETVSVVAKSASVCAEVLSDISGHDAKDGTSHSDALCQSALSVSEVKKVAVVKALTAGIDAKETEKIENFKKFLTASGVEVCEIDGELLKSARIAWNILMCAELCNNVSKYDGIKYGYRSPNYTTIGELYTNSRTEAFGELLKNAILFGSETLSTENYMRMYDKAMRVRRVISEYFAELFAEYDALLLPAVSGAYTEEDVKNNKYIAFEENLYTAPASISGLPAVVVGGVQLMGKAFSEGSLLAFAKNFEEGDR